MSLIGLQTYIFLKLNFFFNKKKFFLSAIILGLLLPEIDSIFLSIYYFITGSKIDTSIFDKNFTHSFITLSIIYLMFLIFYEIKKETYIVNFARSVMIGMTSNIILLTAMHAQGRSIIKCGQASFMTAERIFRRQVPPIANLMSFLMSQKNELS